MFPAYDNEFEHGVNTDEGRSTKHTDLKRSKCSHRVKEISRLVENYFTKKNIYFFNYITQRFQKCSI